MVLATIGTQESDATIDSPADIPVAPGAIISVGSHRLHLNCTGRGSPTVIFDSGLGGSSLDWVRVQPVVATFTRACSYDRAGYGWSDAGPQPRDSEHISRELEILLRNAGVTAPYLLVGHSFGSFNVRLYSHNNPNKVAGLLLIDPSHEDQFRRFEAEDAGSVAPRHSTFVVGNPLQIPHALPADVFAVAQSLSYTRRSRLAFRSELGHLRASAAQLRIRSALPDIPVIVLSHRISATATNDTKSKRAKIWMNMQTDLARRAANGKHLIATTNDHYIHLSQPELVVDSIRDMVEQSDENIARNPAHERL